MHVHIGCGYTAPVEWLNFDASPRVFLERLPLIGRLIGNVANRFPANVKYGDIVTGLDIPAGSVDAIYASHVFEHLPRVDCVRALINCRRLLKSGGTLRLIVPDLRARADIYVASSVNDPEAAHRFIQSLGMGLNERPTSHLNRLTQRLGNSMHLWMWDEPSMRVALEQAGFAIIRRCEFGDSEDFLFRLVETPSRFLKNGIKELAMEAKKI